MRRPVPGVRPTVQIEIWSDVVCPWCYVGKRRLEAALAGFEHAEEVEVVFRSFELDPTAPRSTGGTPEPTTGVIARKYGRSIEDMRHLQQQLVDLAAEDGLDLRLFDTVHTNTVDAHRLLHLALEAGGPQLQQRLKEALLAAYFTDARDVGDPEVLTQVAVGVGLEPDRVAEVLAGEEYAAAVAGDVAQAQAFGATGVPFFVVDRRYAVSGAQPTEVFAQLLDRAWQESRPTLEPVGTDGEVCGPDGCPV